MKVKALLYSMLHDKKEIEFVEPKVVKPSKTIEIKQYGLATGKIVRVRRPRREYKIEIKYKETK